MNTLLRKLSGNNEFLSLSGNILYTLLGFASFVFLTRTYPAGVFGSWVLYVTAATFVEMLRFGITKYAVIRHLSAAQGLERKSLLGSHWVISFAVTIIVVILIIFVRFLFPQTINHSGYEYFFKWYPLLALANLSFNNSLNILQADERFGKILLIRFLNIGSFVLFLGINRFIWQLDIETVIIVHLAINLLSSAGCLLMKWDGFSEVLHAKKENIRQIIDFGKYSTGTTLGSNMLKSSDTIIIGLSPFLGAAGVAFYSIPLKIIELFEIPLRSFAATSFPRMSRLAGVNDYKGVRNLFYSYSGVLTLVFIPLCAVGYLYSTNIAVWLAGREYSEAGLLIKIFMITALLLPVDRFAGIALDSINNPKRNFYKILIQNSFNLSGAIIILVYYYQCTSAQNPNEALVLFAILSILTTFSGIVSGISFLAYRFSTNPLEIIRHGLRDIMHLKRQPQKTAEKKNFDN